MVIKGILAMTRSGLGLFQPPSIPQSRRCLCQGLSAEYEGGCRGASEDVATGGVRVCTHVLVTGLLRRRVRSALLHKPTRAMLQEGPSRFEGRRLGSKDVIYGRRHTAADARSACGGHALARKLPV